MTRLRRTIAARLVEAQATAAILTTFNEIDMSAVMAARSRHKDAFEKKHGVRLGFTSFFAKAVVAALREVPEVNAEIDGDEIVFKNYYDLGMAVSAPTGLVVPVIRDCDREELRRDRVGARRGRRARARRQALARRDARRHVHDQQRRRVRVVALDADPEPPAVGDSRPAQDRGPADRAGRPGGDPADDVRGALLRPPSGRRPRGGHVPRAREAGDRGSRAPAARC